MQELPESGAIQTCGTNFTMRRALIILGVTLFAIAIAAYLYFSGREYEFRFNEEQLQQKLSERMPIKKRYYILFEVTLDNPRVALVDGSDKLNAGLDLTLNIRLNNEEKQLGGTIDVLGGVRYDNEKGQFFVTDPVIEKLSVQGIPDKFTDRTNKVLSIALREYFSSRPIYTLDTTKVKQAITKLVLKKVVVEDEELVVVLGI